MVGVPCSLCDAAGNSLERSAISDSQGMVSFDVTAGDYVIMADYLGALFPSEIFTVPGTLSATLLIEHQQVAVTVTGTDGLTEEPLAGLHCSLFTEAGVDTGIIATTDVNGVAYFNVPFNSYRGAVDYLGQGYWTEVFDWYNTTLTIPLGSLSLHVTDLGVDVADTEVYLFTDAGEYLGLNSITDSTGAAVFQVPEGAYRLRVDYNGGQYWSDVVHVLAYQDNPVTLALDLLALGLSNNPHPIRFDGNAPEYRLMLATVGTLDGLLAVTDSQLVVNNEPKTYYYISDHLSTAQLLVDEFGEVVWQGNYSPFGAVDVVVNEVENSFRFPGQYYDSETGLHYNWHRFYDPDTGRYISADPIGLDGGINLYAYVGGDPVNAVDPWGLKWGKWNHVGWRADFYNAHVIFGKPRSKGQVLWALCKRKDECDNEELREVYVAEAFRHFIPQFNRNWETAPGGFSDQHYVDTLFDIVKDSVTGAEQGTQNDSMGLVPYLGEKRKDGQKYCDQLNNGNPDCTSRPSDL